MPSNQRGLRAEEAVVLGLLAAIWGASFLFIKVALRDVGPLALVAIRVSLAGVALGAFLLVRRGRAGVRALFRGVRPLDAVILSLTASALPFSLISWAETRISSSLAGILNASLPLLTALLAFRVDPLNRLRGWRSAGLLVGFAGVALVAGTDVGGSPLGVVAMFAAVASYAVSAHFAKQRFAHVEPVGVALVQTLVSSALVVPVALTLERPDHVPSAVALGSLAALGLGGTAVAWAMYYWLLAHAGPQHTVAVTYLTPVFAVLYGTALLHERLTAPVLVGAAIIIAGELITAAPSRGRVVEELYEAVP